MTIEELHYQFKITLNKVDSAQRLSFNDAEIDWLINEAQKIFIKQRVDGHSFNKLGLDESQKRIDDLTAIHIKFPQQPLIATSAPTTQQICGRTVYITVMNINQLTFPYFRLTRIVAIKSGVHHKTMIVSTNDLDEYLKSPFHLTKSHVLVNMGNNRIYVYSLAPITHLLLEYIKLPIAVSKGTYTYLDNTTRPAQTLELSEHTHSEIIDIAVLLALQNINDPALQIQQLKISQQE